VQTLVVLIMSTLLAVTYASYVGEYSRRRLQLLLYRM
jgi:Tfp pilus assembly protein PilE